MANSAVFNIRPNAGSDWISLTEVGRGISRHARQQPKTHDHQKIYTR